MTNPFFQMLFSWKGLTFLLCLIAMLLLIKLFDIISKRNSKRKELRRAAAERARDENLNEFILNSHTSSTNKEKFVPYDVDYSQSDLNTSKQAKLASADVMVQIVERTELSSRKFVLNASKGITIGTTEGCDITFIGDGKEENQCQLRAFGKDVIVRDSTGETKNLLVRKKNRAIINNNGIKLMTGDIIVMGSVCYEISLVK